MNPFLFQRQNLDNELVRNGGDHLGLFTEEFYSMSFTGLLVDALNVDKGSGFFGSLDGGVVSDNTVQKSLTRFRVFHVLDSDVNTFRNDTAVVLNAKN